MSNVVLPVVLGGGRSVPLSPVLEPVPDLGGCESGGLGQLSLLAGVGVGVLEVPLPEQRPRTLLKAVCLLLAVPDGAGQRELFAHTILVHGSKWSSA